MSQQQLKTIFDTFGNSAFKYKGKLMRVVYNVETQLFELKEAI